MEPKRNDGDTNCACYRCAEEPPLPSCCRNKSSNKKERQSFAEIMGCTEESVVSTSDIERIARNIAKEKGLDFDAEFNAFKEKFGLK